MAHVKPAVVQNGFDLLVTREELAVAQCCAEHDIAYVSQLPAGTAPGLYSLLSQPDVTRIAALYTCHPHRSAV